MFFKRKIWWRRIERLAQLPRICGGAKSLDYRQNVNRSAMTAGKISRPGHPEDRAEFEGI
jgi:hypothetical protein